MRIDIVLERARSRSSYPDGAGFTAEGLLAWSGRR